MPNKIFLQVKDEEGEWQDIITWCEDRIYDTDVEYIRVNMNPGEECRGRLSDADEIENDTERFGCPDEIQA